MKRKILMLALVVYCLAGCGKKKTPETWDGSLTGTSKDWYDTQNGLFNEAYTFNLTVPSSLFEALQIPYDANAAIREGSGTFSGTETVQDNSSAYYTLHPSAVADVPITVTDATIIVESTGPTPKILFKSTNGETLIRNWITNNATSADVSHEAYSLELTATSVTATTITGTWKNTVDENLAQGTFSLTKR